MAKCNTCGLFVHQFHDEFVRDFGDQPSEAFDRIDAIDMSGRVMQSHVYYCVAQESSFKSQLPSEFSIQEGPYYEIAAEEHDCPFYMPKHSGITTMNYIDKYIGLRKVAMIKPISITGGGIFIGAQIGGIANEMNTYIDQLHIGEFASEDEKDLKEALAELRTAIESSKALSEYEKQAAAADLAYLSNELVKPADNQKSGAKKLFWDRLNTVLKAVPPIVALLTKVGKLIALI